jgi:uncharacterized protein
MSSDLIPFFFGEANRRLFGVLHASAQPVTKGGVLLCNPFGQEAIRAHRALRSLADRLARQGHAVLRFDYAGSGDSMGSDEEVDLNAWAADVVMAHGELQARAQVPVHAWIGMRLGAAVALRAAGQLAELPRMVLWEPVLDGAAYLHNLRQSHVANLSVALGVHAAGHPRQRARDSANYRDEACGFAMPEAFRQSIETLQLDQLRVPASVGQVLVVADKTRPDAAVLEKWMSIQQPQPKYHDAPHDIDWMAESMDEGSLVPGAAMLTLAKAVESA